MHTGRVAAAAAGGRGDERRARVVDIAVDVVAAGAATNPGEGRRARRDRRRAGRRVTTCCGIRDGCSSPASC
jgi:hypothetical protein